MTSIAAKAMKQARHLIAKGSAPLMAWNEALKPYDADRAEHNGEQYARFDDRSYAHMTQKLAYTITERASKFVADKIVDGIFLHCDECGAEIWCDRNGQGRAAETFDISGKTVHVCDGCQRAMVVRQLVGE